MTSYHHQHLGMHWQGQTYVWTHLPFGLSASPYIFCKTLRETITLLRRRGIRVNCYMDDLLILGRTKEECEEATLSALRMLEDFGWKVNKEKSHNGIHSNTGHAEGEADDLEEGDPPLDVSQPEPAWDY